MARTLLFLVFLFLSSAQVFADRQFPQPAVRGGLSDIIATPTPTPKLRLRQFNNGTTTTTSVDPEDSPDPTPDSTTQIPVFIPPTTVVSGAAQTTAAKQIGPVLWKVWNSRNLLKDDNTKQQYIDLVDNTKNDVTNLFDKLTDQPTPHAQCCQTSLRKRSLISGITNLLKTAADIVSCAECVVNNLDNLVKGTDIDVDVVDLLTDTLADLTTQLDDLDNDDDDNNSKTTDQQSSQTSETSSGCTSSTVTDCKIDLYESTTFYITDGTTTSDITTSSSTACQTITACSVEATTATTTIAASTTLTSSEPLCNAENCLNNVCPLPTDAPSSKPRRSIQVQEEAPPLRKRWLKFFDKSRKVKRSLADPPDRSDGQYVPRQCAAAGPASELDWAVLNSPIVSGHGAWGGDPQFPWIQGIAGCTAVVITSKRGYWYSHIIEDGFRNVGDRWQVGLDALQNGNAKTTAPSSLVGPGNILEQTACNDVRMYIMSKGKGDYDDDWNPISIPIYQDKINEIIGVLQTNAGAPLTNTQLIPVYYNPVPGEEEASGRVLIEYDPKGLSTDDSQAAYRVWLENELYPAVQFPAPGSTASRKRDLEARQNGGACPASPSSSVSSSDSVSSTVPSVPLSTGPSTTQDDSTPSTTTDDNTPSTTTSPESSPTVTVKCSNPSLEDGDGLCTCNAWSQTITVTPDGGPGNDCPATIAGFPTGSPPPPVTTTSAPEPAPTGFGCSNPSLEDGDGLCTCSLGSTTTTITPEGGAGNTCPTAMPSTTEIPATTEVPSSTQPLPYQPTGTDSAGNVDKCHVHVWEHLLCDNDDDTNLAAVIQIWDAVGNQILAPTDEWTINANEGGMSFDSPLQNPLVVTGEHKGDYVQFQLGSQNWPSTQKDKSQSAYCSQGKWDMLSDSFWGCSCDDPDCPGVRQMDCWFECPWQS